MRKFLTVALPALVALIGATACDPDDQGAQRPASVSYDVPPTTAGDPDGPAVDRDEVDAPTGRTLPQFPPSGRSAAAEVTTEDSPGWDADTQGNRRYDPDAFNCNTMGNGRCDQGGTPVNGPDPVWHGGLPCYLDFPDVREAITDEQYRSAHERWCTPAR